MNIKDITPSVFFGYPGEELGISREEYTDWLDRFIVVLAAYRDFLYDFAHAKGNVYESWSISFEEFLCPSLRNFALNDQYGLTSAQCEYLIDRIEESMHVDDADEQEMIDTYGMPAWVYIEQGNRACDYGEEVALISTVIRRLLPEVVPPSSKDMSKAFFADTDKATINAIFRRRWIIQMIKDATIARGVHERQIECYNNSIE